MNNQKKKTAIFITITIIAIISILLNIVVFSKYAALLKNKNMEDQLLNSGGIVVEEKKDKEVNTYEEDNKEEIVSTEEENKETEKEYVYKYIEGKEKEVIKEKEVVVEKHILDPTTSTDATVTYIDASGNSTNINIQSGTTINFSAGEHGLYDSVPTSITLTDNQELDITDTIYNPNNVEVNYIFKGFSYSGNTMTCMYSLASNTVNVECKQIAKLINKASVQYIQLDYIESTGIQYINTGISANVGTKIEYKGTLISSSSANSPYGCRESGSGTYRFDIIANNDKSSIRQGTNDMSGLVDTLPFDASIHTLEYTWTPTTQKVKVDNVEYSGSSATYSSTRPIYLFGINNAGSLLGSSAKINHFKITSGTNVKDLIAVEKVSDGTLGMLDLVSGNFLTNVGSGVFNRSDIKSFPGINAGKVFAIGSYESSSTLTLTAVANDGYTFVKWSDNNTNAEKTITIGDNAVYTALFAPNE